jgi:predicted HicB family RNase H-like nuclease
MLKRFVAFRADEATIATLAAEARRSGVSLSEVIRDAVREKAETCQ